MDIQGYIIEQCNIVNGREVWEPFSHKIYKTVDIAENAYRQQPDCYKNTPMGDGGKWNMKARLVTILRDGVTHEIE